MTARLRHTALASALVALVAACSGGGDAAPPSASGGAGTASTIETPSIPSVPSPSPAGTGVIVIGGATSSFAVQSCRLEPDPAEPVAARALVSLEGSGTTGSGVAFTVELQRFATGTSVVTYTDTVTYSDVARILQAQRVEVNGQVTDLRDPKAVIALVRTRAGGLSASGLASAPGAQAGDGGLIAFALDATC